MFAGRKKPRPVARSRKNLLLLPARVVLLAPVALAESARTRTGSSSRECHPPFKEGLVRSSSSTQENTKESPRKGRKAASDLLQRTPQGKHALAHAPPLSNEATDKGFCCVRRPPRVLALRTQDGEHSWLQDLRKACGTNARPAPSSCAALCENSCNIAHTAVAQRTPRHQDDACAQQEGSDEEASEHLREMPCASQECEEAALYLLYEDTRIDARRQARVVVRLFCEHAQRIDDGMSEQVQRCCCKVPAG